MRLILSFMSAIALTAFMTDPLQAMDIATCNRYADGASKENTRWSQLKCGVQPEKFATDHNAHKRWCRGVKDGGALHDERSARAHTMTKCAMCRHYSNEANAAARENVAFRCGFNGPGWLQEDGGPDDAHFTWCMGLSGQYNWAAWPWTTAEYSLGQVNLDLKHEFDARNKELRECKEKVDQRFSENERKFCRDYSDKAARHAMLNLRKQCGATPAGRWSVNSLRHFEWCLTMVGNDADKAVVERETAAREYAAGFCERGVKLSAEGFPPRPAKNVAKKQDQTATKTMEGRPAQQKQPKTSGGAGSAEGRVGSGGYTPAYPGGDSEAVRRLGGGGGGGGYTPAYSGGSKSGGATAPKTGGAAIITPVQAPVQTQPRAVKSLGKSDDTVDYGGGPKAPPPMRPPK